MMKLAVDTRIDAQQILLCLLFLVPASICRAQENTLLAAPTVQPIALLSDGDVQGIISPREVTVEILGDPVPPNDIQRIFERVQHSWAINAEWLKEQIASREPGEEIPYHPKFGVSEQGWKNYRAYMENLRMIPIAVGKLRFVQQSDKSVFIQNIEGLPEFHGIIIDLSEHEVLTPWGTAEYHVIVLPSQEQKATGPFRAYLWTVENGSVESGNASSASLYIGQLVETGHSMIYLRAIAVRNGAPLHRYRTVIRFSE